MKVVQSLLITAVAALPAFSLAQSNQPLTRAEVRAQLVQLKKAGYSPASDQAQYARNIEVAQGRVNSENELSASSYGSSTAGSSAYGSHAADSQVIVLGPIYAKR